MNKFIKWWRGRCRLFWNQCPACNCDAPATYTCKVCDNYRHSGKEYPPSKATKELWWLHYWLGDKEYTARCRSLLNDVFGGDRE